MKSLVCLVLLSLADAQWWRNAGRAVQDAGEFVRGAAQGSWDMGRAYHDMRKANYRESDKYFHARGNYDAAQRGPGGRWAAEVLSNGRENWQSSVSGRGHEDTRADQEANAWGRNGGDPNRYRPKGLPNQY
ncbi:serum amyloid A-5 protein-like [Discoglossus pictus]